ncbi:E3 ubiquitin-protein ligase MARCHF3 isoform X1 [Oncorhynchus nerka]|uniref:E3 ubiquitin-protein ligase MARCHF3 isoform X1 n=1 Tax=Oncorhynchus nerka TaxID=8023 RepID=UPI0011302808|nr:E3 ubiquitin-protein ligase MARCH3 isoform X1 [Oncorhynchus nerka]
MHSAVSSAFNPTPLNQRGAGCCLNRRPRHQRTGSSCVGGYFPCSRVERHIFPPAVPSFKGNRKHQPVKTSAYLKTISFCSSFPHLVPYRRSPLPERPMCRICHDGGGQEELLSPCECAGTLGTIHRSCLEHWLSASGTSACELCHYQFTVQRKNRPLMEWVRNPGLRQEKRTLFGDMVCFLLITPLATISGWLCLRGAVDHLHFSSRLEAVGLIALTVALFTIYLFWTLVSLRYHCRLYNEWRQTNQRVVLLLPRSHGEPSAPPSSRGPSREKWPSKETIV